mgnify:CR=1 FL=1
MPGMTFRVHHIIRYVHVDIVGILMNPAMALMLGIAEHGGKAFLNGLESLRGKLGLVFRAEADQQVIGFLFAGTGVQRLSGLGLDNGKLVIIFGGASGAPTGKAFFAFMPGIGYVAGQSAVVIVRGPVANVFADHRILMAAVFISRCPASSSLSRRRNSCSGPLPSARADLSRPPSLPRSARALMISCTACLCSNVGTGMPVHTRLAKAESDMPALAADADISACSSGVRYTVMRGFFEGISSS